jgi:hypothetical protein
MSRAKFSRRQVCRPRDKRRSLNVRRVNTPPERASGIEEARNLPMNSKAWPSASGPYILEASRAMLTRIIHNVPIKSPRFTYKVL